MEIFHILQKKIDSSRGHEGLEKLESVYFGIIENSGKFEKYLELQFGPNSDLKAWKNDWELYTVFWGTSILEDNYLYYKISFGRCTLELIVLIFFKLSLAQIMGLKNCLAEPEKVENSV